MPPSLGTEFPGKLFQIGFQNDFLAIHAADSNSVGRTNTVQVADKNGKNVGLEGDQK